MPNYLIYYVGSGLCLYFGLLLIIAATFISVSNHWVRKPQLAFVVLGGFAIAISSTPFPICIYVTMLLFALLWQTYLCVGTPTLIGKLRLPTKQSLAIAVALFFALVGIYELPYHRLPRFNKPVSVLILADSITAGTGAGDKTFKWPKQLSQRLQIKIDDRSIPGAKCSTALNQLLEKPVNSDMAILEIGGNDLLGSTTEQKFQSDLRALFIELSRNKMQVIMFELPLPPLRNRYGQIQRALAAEFNVALIPKWYLLDVTCQTENTIDSIHLTQPGHNQFADNVVKLLE